MAKEKSIKNGFYVIEMLDAMMKYLKNNDHNFHNRLFMAYCGSCQAITSVGGDYTIFAGRDCYGDHYETKPAPEQCLKCYTTNFIKISKDDMLQLKNTYKGKTAEILIDGIKKGLEKTNFSSLYNQELPRIARKWNRFHRREKIRQINSLLGLQK